MVKEFLEKNWDKLLTLALGALFGWISGYVATQSEIHEIDKKLTTLEANEQSTYKPASDKARDNGIQLLGLRNDLNAVENKQDISQALVTLYTAKMEAEIEKVRAETLKFLTQILKASGKP